MEWILDEVMVRLVRVAEHQICMEEFPEPPQRLVVLGPAPPEVAPPRSPCGTPCFPRRAAARLSCRRFPGCCARGRGLPLLLRPWRARPPRSCSCPEPLSTAARGTPWGWASCGQPKAPLECIDKSVCSISLDRRDGAGWRQSGKGHAGDARTDGNLPRAGRDRVHGVSGGRGLRDRTDRRFLRRPGEDPWERQRVPDPVQRAPEGARGHRASTRSSTRRRLWRC
jgi:hypothetical protein